MASQDGRLTFEETDDTNNVTATYVVTCQDAVTKRRHKIRVDVVKPESKGTWRSQPIVAYLADVFLPSGYPQSVSDDYLPYQIYDSLQAFCSSIAGLLSSRAVLQGVGVGNPDASPTSALFLHILQDTSGRIATILFAHRVGTALEPECKTYRLAADVFNDIAMILDCLSPMIPAGLPRVGVLSAAGVLRALCGVAGGSSKASLSAHFAKWGNMAELNAKDSSQETVLSLVGMLVGTFVVSHITDFTTTWAALLTLLALHLTSNYLAVCSVQMTSINRQRANIVFTSLLESDPELNHYTLRPSEPSPRRHSPRRRNSDLWRRPPTPAMVAAEERIFYRTGKLLWVSRSPELCKDLGTAEIGVSLAEFYRHSKICFTAIPSMYVLHEIFEEEEYMLYLFPKTEDENTKWHACIMLKKGCDVFSQLKAWVHAILAARVLLGAELENQIGDIFTVVERTLHFLNGGQRFVNYGILLEQYGWDLQIGALETRPGRRIESV